MQDDQMTRQIILEDEMFGSGLRYFALSKDDVTKAPQKTLAAHFLLNTNTASSADRFSLLDAFERNMLLTAEAEPKLGKDILVHVSPRRALRRHTYTPQSDFESKVLSLWPDVLMYYAKQEPVDAYRISNDAIHSELTLPAIRCALFPVFNFAAHVKLAQSSLSKEEIQQIVRDTQETSRKIQPCHDVIKRSHFDLWSCGMRKLNGKDFISAARHLIEVKKKQRVMPEIIQVAREVFSSLEGRTCEEKLKNCMASPSDVLTKPLVRMAYQRAQDVA